MLVLSNGHGEDLIALRVLESLHQIRPEIFLEVLPLVGKGKAFDIAVSEGWISRINIGTTLPSGGFSNQSFASLIQDISAGLLTNTFRQILAVHRLARKGRLILAVGDLLPLALAWSTGQPFGFIGTPKSDYTWQTFFGQSWSDYYHLLKGSEWDPWEYLLMKSIHCKMIAVRDQLTARGLRKHGVDALSLGNPMMDGFQRTQYPESIKDYRRIVLLCGSRMPEAISNLEILLKSINFVQIESSLAIFIAISSEISITNVKEIIIRFGYREISFAENIFGTQACFKKNSKILFLGAGQFPHWASWAEIGLANAGTATEQLVGLQIPVVSLPGKGPQFNKSFALRQSRLLGGAVIPCKNSKEFARTVELLLGNPSLRNKLGRVGLTRMGREGGSYSLAQHLSSFLLY